MKPVPLMLLCACLCKTHTHGFNETSRNQADFEETLLQNVIEVEEADKMHQVKMAAKLLPNVLSIVGVIDKTASDIKTKDDETREEINVLSGRNQKEKHEAERSGKIETKMEDSEEDKREESNGTLGNELDLKQGKTIQMRPGDFMNEKDSLVEVRNKMEDRFMKKKADNVKNKIQNVRQNVLEVRPGERLKQGQNVKPRPARDLDCQEGVPVLDDLGTELGPDHADRFKVDVMEDLDGLQTEDHRILDLDLIRTDLGIGEDLDVDLEETKEPDVAQTWTEDFLEKEHQVQSEAPHPPDPAQTLPLSWVHLWDELKSLRRLVLLLKGREADHSQAVRTMESRLRDYTQETESRTQDLRERLRETTVQVSGLKTEVLGLKSRLNQSSTENQRKNSQGLGSELLFLQTRLRAAESSMEDLKRKSSVVTSKLGLAESQLQQLQKHSSECLVSNSSEVESELETRLKQELDQLQKNTQESHGQVWTKLDSLQEDLDRTVDRHTAVLSDVSELNLKLNRTHGQIQELKTSAAEVRVGLADLNNNASGRLQQLQTQDTFHSDQLESVKTRLEQLQTQSTDVSLRLNQTESQVQELRTGVSAHSGRLASVETSVEQLQTETKADISELNLRLNSSHGQVQELKTSAADRLEAVEKHLEHLQTENTAEITEFRSNIMDLRITVSNHSNHRESVEKHLEHLQKKSADVSVRLNLTESQVQELRAGLSGVDLEAVEKHLEMFQAQGEAVAEELQSVSERVREVQTHSEADITELKSEISDLKNSVSVQCGHLETHLEQLQTDSKVLLVRLETAQTHLEQLQNQDKAQSDRVESVEKYLEHLQKENKAAAEELRAMFDRIHEFQIHTEELQISFSAGDEELRKKTEAVSVRLDDSENTLQHLKKKSEDVTQRLNSTENRLEQLSDSAAGLSLRLSRGERLIQDLLNDTSHLHLTLNHTAAHLSNKITVQTSDLSALRTHAEDLSARMKQLQAFSRDLTQRLNSTEDRLMLLSDSSTGVQKVAFSAGLSDSGAVGPFDSETVLLFTKVITNDGSAYDTSTGLFSAPVRGLYFFSFTAVDFVKGYTGVYLYHNQTPVSFSLVLNSHGGYGQTGQSVVLRLEPGDTVSLRLPASYRLYDDARNFSIFSGFILFTL